MKNLEPREHILNEIQNRFSKLFVVVLLIPTIFSFIRINQKEELVKYFVVAGLYIFSYFFFELLKKNLSDKLLIWINGLFLFAFVPYIFFIFVFSTQPHMLVIPGDFVSIILFVGILFSMIIPAIVFIISILGSIDPLLKLLVKHKK